MRYTSVLLFSISHTCPGFLYGVRHHFGLHGITEGRPKRGNFKTESFEMYTNWFTTVTTRHIPGTPLDVTNQQQAIEALENEFHPKHHVSADREANENGIE